LLYNVVLKILNKGLVLGHRLRFKGLLFLSAGMSDGDSSDLSNEGEPQATSRSALRNGSGKED